MRRAAHALGFRFRLHRKDLPGKPDVVFPKHAVAMFVHGCFWHRHAGCRKASTPKSRVEYWSDKFERNVERDARAEAELRALGWRVHVVWECETYDAQLLRRSLQAVLGPGDGTFLAEGTAKP